MTVSISLKNFDEHREEYHKLRLNVFNHQESGVEANKRDLDLMSNYYHEQKIKAITGEEILNFIVWLKENRKNGAGSINRKNSSLKSYCKYLRFIQVKGAENFPIESLPRAREPYNGPVNALTSEEVKRIFECIDKESVLGLRDHLFYSLLYRLGLRVGEAVSIDIKDIDFDNEILLIHGKGRRERRLPILPDLMSDIENWIIHRQKLHRASQSEALFVSKKGNRLSIRTAQDNLQKIVKKSGPFSIEKVTPHSFRHAFATHAIEGEQDLFVLKAIMGHASSKSTEIYLHPSMRILKKAVNDHIASDILNEIITKGHVIGRVHQRHHNAVP